jgi:hypothetical protein
MAISLISPGIKVTEQDMVTSQAVTASTAGGFAGQFRWGPIDYPTLVISETDLVSQFGKPSTNTNVDFLAAANFLAYSNQLFVVRTANTPLNATAEATTGSGTAGTGLLIKNKDVYLNTTSFNVGPWLAKYAGALGNSLKVSICPSANAWSSTLTGTFTVAAGGTLVTGSGSAANTELTIGDYVTLNGRTIRVSNTINANAFSLSTAHLTGATSASATRRWEYFNEFDSAPGTSTMATLQGASNDELHVAIVDEEGDITGTAGYVLEKFGYLSKASNARSDNGGTNYYRTVINDRSQYVWWAAHDNAGTNWGNAFITSGAAVTYTAVSKPKSYSLAGGADSNTIQDGDRITSYGKLANKQEVPATVIIAGQANATVINRIISDVAESRKDVVACISPLRANVVNNAGSEASAIATWADTVTRSSYVVADSGWKYQYDKYNDTYTYVPLNGDTAGIIARNDATRDPWLSPAGYANGGVLNIVKLAFNPNQDERDTLYKTAVNPVFTQVGRGTVLFGDKTFITKPVSTNRINVRKLFIELQRTISDAANAVLFDQNDATTRSGFVNLIVPYLRSVQARRGITAFSVVCDERNNPDSVVNNNEFVCDIYIQPIRSVNFVQLNFVSVAGSVSFTEVTS